MAENEIFVDVEVTPEQDLGNFKAYLETFKQRLFLRADPTCCPIACYRAWQVYQKTGCDEAYDPGVMVFSGSQDVEGVFRVNYPWEQAVIREIDRSLGMISGEEVLGIVSLYEGGLL